MLGARAVRRDDETEEVLLLEAFGDRRDPLVDNYVCFGKLSLKSCSSREVYLKECTERLGLRLCKLAETENEVSLAITAHVLTGQSTGYKADQLVDREDVYRIIKECKKLKQLRVCCSENKDLSVFEGCESLKMLCVRLDRQETALGAVQVTSLLENTPSITALQFTVDLDVRDRVRVYNLFGHRSFSEITRLNVVFATSCRGSSDAVVNSGVLFIRKLVTVLAMPEMKTLWTSSVPLDGVAVLVKGARSLCRLRVDYDAQMEHTNAELFLSCLGGLKELERFHLYGRVKESDLYSVIAVVTMLPVLKELVLDVRSLDSEEIVVGKLRELCVKRPGMEVLLNRCKINGPARG